MDVIHAADAMDTITGNIFDLNEVISRTKS